MGIYIMGIYIMGIYKLNSKSKLRYSGSIGGIKVTVRKKMLSLFLSSLILLLILPAICSANELITEKKVIIYNDTFEGESENWEAKYLLNEKHVFITANRKTHYFWEGQKQSYYNLQRQPLRHFIPGKILILL